MLSLPNRHWPMRTTTPRLGLVNPNPKLPDQIPFMNLASTIARLLLGLIFVVFGLNFWLHFIPIPPFPEGSQASAFMGAMYLTGYLTTVKTLEVTGGLLLLTGRFPNLALAILGPIVINIALFHLFLAGGGFELPALIGVLSLIALAGRKDFASVLFAAK
jgi:putative oxidoreductase